MKNIQHAATNARIAKANHLQMIDTDDEPELSGIARYDLAGAEMSAIETLEERGLKVTTVPGLSDGLQRAAAELLAAFATEPIAFMEQLERTHHQPRLCRNFLKSLEDCTALAERDLNRDRSEEPQTAA